MPFAGWWRAVVEDMAEMPATAAAMLLDAREAEGRIGPIADSIGERGPEARPTSAAVELGLRRIHRQRAARTGENPRAMFVEEGAVTRTIGRFLPQRRIGSGRQTLFPFGIGQRQFEFFRRGGLGARGSRESTTDHGGA
jgi:hypothetical protein